MPDQPKDTVYVGLSREQAELVNGCIEAGLSEDTVEHPAPFALKQARAKLVAALDNPVEGEEEFRVVGENFRGEPYETEPVHRLTDAEYDLEVWKDGGALSGRIQARTVFRTEWTDVEEGNRGD